MNQTNYHLDKTLDLPFDQAVERVKATFKEEGFGALSEIDIQTALKEKIGAEIDRYTILGMCNPKLAHEAMGIEPTIGVLLPCNVLVREADGRIEVSAQDPSTFSSFTGNPELEPIAHEARQRIDRALAAI